MDRIVLDDVTASQLQHLTFTVELYNSSGRLLGRFVPHLDKSEWEPVGPTVSEDELDRREAAGEKTYTTAEVLAYLESS